MTARKRGHGASSTARPFLVLIDRVLYPSPLETNPPNLPEARSGNTHSAAGGGISYRSRFCVPGDGFSDHPGSSKGECSDPETTEWDRSAVLVI